MKYLKCLLLLNACLAPSLLLSQIPDSGPCCENATCLYCWDVELCSNTPGFDPENAISGGFENCGGPGPTECSSWTENAYAGADAGCILGCPDPEACNYDANAFPPDSWMVDALNMCVYPFECETCTGEIDGTGTVVDNDGDNDGICDDIDDCVGVEDACGVCNGNGLSWDVSTSTLGGGFYQDFSISAASLSSVSALEISLSAQGAGSLNWASDLLVALVDPSGNGVEWGGDDVTTYGAGYASDPSLAWPSSWNVAANSAGSFSATLDFSAFGLSGEGEWTLYLANGYSGSGEVMYSVSIGIAELCEDTPGCTDVNACNYSANEDCEYLSCLTLYLADFSENAGVIPTQYVYNSSSSNPTVWGISGPTSPNNSNGQLSWANAEVTCSWASQTVSVAGYSSLNLNVTMSESGSFTGTDEVRAYVFEDGVERLVSSQLGNDFESLSIVNEPCTASTSLQVVIMIRNEGYFDALYLDEVSITGTASFTDIDMDGVNDAGDACIDLDGDCTCDDFDPEIMLMDEDFSSYTVGSGLGQYNSTDTDNEAGEAFVAGSIGAGKSGWVLLGEEQKGNITIQANSVQQYLALNRTGTGTTDTTTVTMMTRTFDVSNITSPKVRVAGSETSDFLNADDVTGGMVFYLIEDGVQREVLHVFGEFTSFNQTVASTAVHTLTLVVKGYAMWESHIRLEQISVFGEYYNQGELSNNCDCNGNVLDECGVCGGSGIPAGDCDCFGNVLDACDVCGGTGVDVDADGICDDIDNCTDITSMSFADEGNMGCLYFGCIEPTADNYDSSDNIVGCEPGDDCCIWYGCTDATGTDGSPPACNYDPVATDDDGSCEYLSCAGCTDGAACNFDSTALINVGCDYSCLGCTNPCSGNYDASATIDNGSCQPVLGCMDETACNYDACADLNNGCDYLDACGVCGGPGAIYDCGCTDIPEGDCDCDGNQADAIGVCGGDCEADADGNGICDPLETAGCTYDLACNYDSLSTLDDGSCFFAACGYDCAGNCIVDTDGDGTCDAFEVPGCTSLDAINFHPASTEDDGTCVFGFVMTCFGDIDGDDAVGVGDILEILANFGTICN